MIISEWRKGNGFGDRGRGRPAADEMAARAVYLATPGNTLERIATTRAPVKAVVRQSQATASVATPRVKSSIGNRPSGSTKEIVDAAQPSWGEDITYKDSLGKTISPNEACHNCGYSMRYCKHRVPVALGSDGKRSIITRFQGNNEYLGAFAYFQKAESPSDFSTAPLATTAGTE